MINQLTIRDVNFDEQRLAGVLVADSNITEQEVCARALKEPNIEFLFEVAKSSEGLPLLLTDIAVDSMIPTPSFYQDGENYSLDINDIVSLSLASGFGIPFGSRNIRRGRVVADVFARDDMSFRKDSAFGSSEPFTEHNDGAALPDVTPDLFVLLGIRNFEGVATTIATVEAHQLSKASLEVLMSPIFRIVYEPTHPDSGAKDLPLIELDSEGRLRVIRLFGDSKMGQHSTDRFSAREIDGSYDELKAVLADNREEVVIGSGDALILPNLTYVHGRNAIDEITKVPAESRRWLKRVHIATRKELVDKVIVPGAVIATNYPV